MSKHLLLDQKHPPYQPKGPAGPELILDLNDIQLLIKCVEHTAESHETLMRDEDARDAMAISLEDAGEMANRLAYLQWKLGSILADYVRCAPEARSRAATPSIVTARN